MQIKFHRFFLVLTFIAIPLQVIAQQPPLPQPHKGLMANPAQGKRLFEKKCAQCHGVELKGSDKGPPFLHPVYEPGHHGCEVRKQGPSLEVW
jgi:mono/diheme cytochrome c family protein